MNNVFLSTQSGKIIQAQFNDEDLEELVACLKAGDLVMGVQTSLEDTDARSDSKEPLSERPE